MPTILDDLIAYLERERPGFLNRLSLDPLSPLVLLIGSWAREEAGPFSDIDLLVVTKSAQLASLNALHCFEDEVPSIDILFMSEESFHNETLSGYELNSLLRRHAVMFSRCSECVAALDRMLESSGVRTSPAEIQSLVWHLMHIRSKYAAATHPEIKAVLRAKFLYYYPLAYVAAMGLEPLGEGPAVDAIVARGELGKHFRALTVSSGQLETLALMRVLIDEIANRHFMDDRRFLVEQRDFIVPIRYNSSDVRDVKTAIDWGRRLFDIR